ncbi:MAG TPA: hybrid sensor histidine kinase/response regulator [Oxalobacteraceae bacterium]|nr:hybrid sensor histidine kinase/response regulator [Oxalobacteraceae bacterium]
MRAVEHTQEAVRRFVESPEDASPDVEAFRHVAQNVGALSFFIETLQLQPESAKQRFSFDEDKGLFCAKLLERDEQSGTDEQIVVVPALEEDFLATPAASTAPATPAVVDVAEAILPTVEQELELHQKQSAELARCLSAEPTDTRLQEQLKESLEQVQFAAALVDNPEAGESARVAMDMLENADADETLAKLVTTTAASVAAPSPAPAPAMAPAAPASDEEVDAELLEIFLFEAEEVLACINATIPTSRHDPRNQEHLTTLRRSFHTLKGSGRMVGLTAFGEAAWSIEQVMNLKLSEGQGGNHELYALLEKAAELLSAWVLDLQTQGKSLRRPDALIAAADRVRNGAPFSYEEIAVTEEPAAEATVAALAEVEIAAADAPVDDVTTALAQEAAPELFATEALATPGDDAPAQLEPESCEILEAVEAFDFVDAAEAIDATETIVATEVADTAPAEDLPDVEAAIAADMPASPLDEAAGESETFALEAETPDIPVIEELAIPQPVPVAEVIEFPSMQAPLAARDDGVKYIGDLEISVPLHNIYLAETDDLVRMLANDIAEWRHEPEREVNILAVHAAHSLAGSSATVGFQTLQEVAHGLEMALQCLSRKPTKLSDEEFGTIEASVDRLKSMLQMFALGEMPGHEPEMVQALADLRQAVEARTAELPLDPLAGDAGAEPTLAELEAQEALAASNGMALAEEEQEAPAAELPTLLSAAVPEPALPELPQAEPQVVAPEIAAKPAENDGVAPAVIIKDELDADLLPVFLEEGRDMLPEMGEKLRAWQEKPMDASLPQALLRLLHTVKGSARMAGAMELGQHMHEMETRIEAIMHAGLPSAHSLDDLLARYDYGLQLFEILQNPEAARPAPLATAGVAAAAEEIEAPASAATGLVELNSIMPARPAGFSATPAPAAQKAVAASGPVPLVRVRADILDRLVNQAGEVSISRSRLETEVGTLRGSLSELTENINRLRTQLREIEMQAESQISSRMSLTGERDFDPLEFDRFTRLQELTRMMAESVNDVGSVQQNLLRTVDSASDDLVSQARLTRDLQQDLMRVRMVQFASISERLFRVTRQSAKELDKRVNLDIRGSSVEMDRSVLERMAGPFEHLLRNAIVHGIESKEKRRAADKNEIGELLVEIRQEGNEVVIQFNDDGAGLDVDRIRDKAQSQGLLSDGMSESEVTDLIFHPGFSTADAVTELAGRGVGMDVVRSEAAALGGRVALKSEPGKGAQFTIHLPLTLAVTQVVLLSTGGKVYAVPSVLVEQVQQLKTNALTAAYNEGAVMWQGQRVPMHYLSTLLGDRDATAVAQQYTPLVIMKSGSDRVALHVDEVVGNREVVVKNIGPQLARMIGIAGATVLGSGEIVLILNPVPLAQRAAQDNIRAPRLVPSDAPDNMGAVAEMATGKPSAPKSDTVQGLRTQNIVMVVDDSLTVRRVTQRLLVREGYQVVLAKDGVDALEQLQAITPDVMLVDIEMPRMDGFDLTRNVRGDERTRHIPIIMITSRTATKHRNYAMELGVNEYLGKPYQEDDLLKSIAGFINKEIPVN